MVGLRSMQTRTEAFWRDDYRVSDGDLDVAAGVILESTRPQPLEALAEAVVRRRFQDEKEAATRQARTGDLYQPKGTYAVGQVLIFSAHDFASARVIDVRPGNNPKYGDFAVIRVAFEQSGREREFAAEFNHPHPLNRPVEELLGGDDASLSEADVVNLGVPSVVQKLESYLATHPDYVQFSGMWFLRDLLPEIHVGYLNLAEAVIYEAARPMETREMLADLSLPATSTAEAQTFALNRALGSDERFDNVGTADDPLWYLRALEPEGLHETPAVLRPAFRAAGGEYVGLTMLDLVDEVGDELDDLESMILHEVESVRYEVVFPHLYAGTMPLSLRLRRLLPTMRGRHMPFRIVDSRTGHRFEVWAVPEEHFLCGLGEWYHEIGMCVGGQVTVSPTDDPGTLSVTVVPSRGKRTEWIRSASVEDDELVLQMQRSTVAVRCDRNMLVDIPDREAIARLMAAAEAAQLSMPAMVRSVFQEQAKLSSRGIVHAKSIYSAANLLRRTGSVPVFAELTRRACYDPVGDGHWAFDPELVGTVYQTPDDMRDRPASRREDLIRDQVVQYLGR
ncbi:MAG: hypothetical protein ACYC5M_02040 [Anaerolineae bacterium]